MKHLFKFTTLLLICALALAMLPVETVAAAPVDALRSGWGSSACPWTAVAPCSSQWVTLITTDYIGISLWCQNSSNPIGFYKNYTYYTGWIYKDAKGTSYIGWFSDILKGTVVGPWKTVGKQTYKLVCVTGLAGPF